MLDSLTVKKNYKTWTKFPFDSNTIELVKNLKHNEPEKFFDSFYKNLEFGTGGMRGIMGLGPNRINKYTLGKNTQGISNYINKENIVEKSVAIAYDCRNNSEYLAKKVSEVFSANGIKVYLFSSLRPTPILSYCITKLSCTCGIVLTASHNPPEYNGYKVYWTDGGQIVPPIDEILTNEINRVDYNEIKFEIQKNLIQLIDKKIDDSFLKDSIKFGKIGRSSRENLKIVFTPIHGTSYKILPNVLKSAGFSDLSIVDEQKLPDGNFPTVKSPNPEEESAFDYARKLAIEKNADIFLGTDPDADRLGVGIKDSTGNFFVLNGNQIMVILINYLLEKEKNKESCFIGSTIVSTPMLKNIADQNGVELKLGLTGFKWISKMVEDFPKKRFLCGGEESNGFVVGDFVRDKDAITTALLFCELASDCKKDNSDVFNYLLDCYIKFGFFKEKLVTIKKDGVNGSIEINRMMEHFRNLKKNEIAGTKLVSVKDFLSSEKVDFTNNKKTNIDLPKSNVLIFELSDGSEIAVRPSGTEPKIKFYFSVNTLLNKKNMYYETNKKLDLKLNELIKEFSF